MFSEHSTVLSQISCKCEVELVGECTNFMLKNLANCTNFDESYEMVFQLSLHHQLK